MNTLRTLQAESGNATGGAAVVDAADYGTAGQVHNGDKLSGSPPRTLKPSEGDSESNRMSLSSLYSLGSGIYNGAARAIGTSYPSSVTGSEAEGKQLQRTTPLFQFTKMHDS